ncbi:hypothetical protein [Brevibacterium sp.]|uniref:hypothetical protein n=1 Tax=Brevibacterium sp. TaxID=1701 RepID=UPI0025C367DB|nr:hypothetical protein [Brevibacterium sp.]
MAGSIIVSIVYSAVPILAILIGFTVVRRDYGRPPGEPSQPRVPGSTRQTPAGQEES